MSIDRVTPSVDLYSHLRLDVYLHGQSAGRQAPPGSESGNVAVRHTRQGANGLSLDVDDRPRSRQWDSRDDGVVVPFERPATELTDEQADYGGTAEEIPLTLDGGGSRGDVQLLHAARLYTRSGRSVGVGSSDLVGTLLDTMA